MLWRRTLAQEFALRLWGSLLFEMKRNCERIRFIAQQAAAWVASASAWASSLAEPFRAGSLRCHSLPLRSGVAIAGLVGAAPTSQLRTALEPVVQFLNRRSHARVMLGSPSLLVDCAQQCAQASRSALPV